MGINLSGNTYSDYSRKVFKNCDDRDSEILSILGEKAMSNAYKILVSTKPEQGKNPKIPRSTLYRRIEKLRKNGFIREIRRERFVRGRLNRPMPIYTLTYKGLLASMAHRVPQSESEDDTKIFGMMLGWLRWHAEKGLDLSEAEIDLKYFVFSLILAEIEHPEWFPSETAGTIEKLRSVYDVIQLEYDAIEQMIASMPRTHVVCEIFARDGKFFSRKRKEPRLKYNSIREALAKTKDLKV